MIGLILGDTNIGNYIIKKLKLYKKNYIIIDISKNKIFKGDKNSYSLSLGQLGKAISILKKNHCKKVIFAGRINRPNFSKTKFDLKALLYLPKIISSSKKGDAYIIKEIIKIFSKEKIRVLNQVYFNPELVLRRGICTRRKIDFSSKKDITIGKRIIKDIKLHNVGQSIVVSNGIIIAVEDQRGTDSMLDRANKILKKAPGKIEKKGILLKFPKSNQDLRVDLPTVGIKTINKCSKIGLKGVVVKANQNILLDKSKCIKIANKKNMFICAI